MNAATRALDQEWSLTVTDSVPTPDAPAPETYEGFEDTGHWVVGSSGPRRVATPVEPIHHPLPDEPPVENEMSAAEPVFSDPGGWLTGSMVYPAGPVVEGPPDEFTGDETVGYAVHWLRAFGGNDMSNDVAAVLLAMWQHNRELTDNERHAIYRRFPRRTAGDPR